jgi:hypothetical protein
MKNLRPIVALLIMLILFIGYVPNTIYVTDAQGRREGEVRFRGIVVDPNNVNQQSVFPICDPAYYCIDVQEIIDDPNNIFGGYRGPVEIFPELYNPEVASIGDVVEVYASCDVDYARDPFLMCYLSRVYHYIRRLSGQTATVTMTSTITSTVTTYTTVTSRTVTRTVTQTRASYVTSTTTTDVTETFTVTRTTTTTVTRTTTTTVTKQQIRMLSYTFKETEEPPVSINRILEYLKVRETLVSGDFYVKIEPANLIKSVQLELKLRYVKAGEYPFREYEETKTYTLDRLEDGFGRHIEEVRWVPQPGELLKLIVQSFIGKFIKDPDISDTFTPEYRVYLTGNERWYVSIEIARVFGVDVYGNYFEFPIRKSFDTALGKIVKSSSTDYLYTTALSPVALSVVDSSGRRVGLIGGKIYSEIEGAIYLGSPGSLQVIVITQPKQETYQITVEGSEKGTFTLISTYVKEGKRVITNVERSINIDRGERRTFAINLQSPALPPTKTTETSTLTPYISIYTAITPPYTYPTTVIEQTTSTIYLALAIIMIVSSTAIVGVLATLYLRRGRRRKPRVLSVRQ